MNYSLVTKFYEEARKRVSFSRASLIEAAKIVESLPQITKMADIENVKGLGKTSRGIIQSWLATGPHPEDENILVQIPGITHALAQKLWDYGIRSQDALSRYPAGTVLSNGVTITESMATCARHLTLGRMPWKEADAIVTELICPRDVVCGSYRRIKPTCGDIDIVCADMQVTLDYAIHHGFIPYLKGDKKISGIFKGRQVDLRQNAVGNPPQRTDTLASTMVLYFTGSKEFNIKCRTAAAARGFLLNEYGLFKNTGEFVTGSEYNVLEMLELQTKPCDR